MNQLPLKRFWNRRFVKLARWLVVWLVLYAAFVQLYNRSYPYTRDLLIHRMQAIPAAALINLTDNQARAVAFEEMIISSRVTINIARGCDGFEAWGVLITALISFPMAMKKRLMRVGLGTALIYALNQVRIVSIYHIASVRPDLFDLVHGLIWQSLMILIAVLFVIPSLEPQDDVNHAAIET